MRDDLSLSGGLADKDFGRLAEFIQRGYGIKMPPAKKAMLESRLQSRVTQLGMNGYAEYVDYLLSEEGLLNELPAMISRVTTNKTEFFRSPVHFEILTTETLPELARSGRRDSPIRFWSAGCSTGEEPYTIAMVVEEYCATAGRVEYEILATDLSPQALGVGRRAVYAAGTVT